MRRRLVPRLLAALALVVLIGACAEGGLGSGAAAPDDNGGGDDTTTTTSIDEDLSDLSDFSDFTDLSDFTDFSDFSIPDFTDFTDFSDFSDFTDFTDFSDFDEPIPIDELTAEPIPDDTPSDEMELAQDCFDGDMEACDSLYFEAEIGSDVEDWANRCGGRFDESPGLCTVAVEE